MKSNFKTNIILHKYALLLVCVWVWMGSFAQINPGDTLKILSPEQFISWVKQYHPVAKQAGLFVDQAEAELLASRGMFDPQLYYVNEQKTFDGKVYYNYMNTQLKVPTWFGVELEAGIANNTGEFLNPEFTVDQSSFVGFSVPLAKNLLMDKRRAVLKQAQSFVQLSEAEKRLIINDLLFDALTVYWQWANDYQQYLILNDAVITNEQRYKQVKITVEQGDRAGVDSTEALTQLLQFQFLQNQAFMFFTNSGFQLSNFLWDENDRPIVLGPKVVPSIIPEFANPFAQPFKPLPELLSLAGEFHPKLGMIDSKLDILEIERRLKFQSLLPTANIKYNALSPGFEFFQGVNGAFMENNYKFGAELGIPLFLRQGRGDYRSAKIKIKTTELEQSNIRLEIDNKVKYYYNELVNLLEQIRINERAYLAYKKVFEVEVQKFNLGESNLFIVNNREIKLLESRQKLAELKAKFFKTAYGIEWAAGILQ